MFNLSLLQIADMINTQSFGVTRSFHTAFNRPTKGLLFQMSGGHMYINTKNAQYEDLETHHGIYVKNSDTQKDPSIFSILFAVVVQWEDGGPWKALKKRLIITTTRGSYIIWVMKTGKLITWNMKHPNDFGVVLSWINKGAAGWVEDIFIKVVPLDHSRTPKPHK